MDEFIMIDPIWSDIWLNCQRRNFDYPIRKKLNFEMMFWFWTYEPNLNLRR